ncbi:serine/threonine protein kinase [Ktedonospora formicarum]|uniref:non-specific serine/threonine protein kinase n=1 Tax=Ktedonospora formicarum TaxID=2778364 RepID=A0A8J3HV56_9CHLR|nr:serine/threonine-protein kinase [Ktedonospora formicarum]GHO42541.1 hypothetical protein KSX_07040 [Ktedonospora formicarum]
MIETVPSGSILHGRYRIERVLGSGGFGHVYLGTDMPNTNLCAVKEYLVTGASGQEQLHHEATVLSHLHHPNMPAFQDAFMERGRYYIVLNYIEGNDLTDLIRLTRQRGEVIPVGQVMSWLLSICDAVHFMHNQRPPIIHRDIKPDNIRIMPNGTAVLVDLGNAKAAADGARTLFFIRHQGTPGYAPPEQYPGGTGTDTRSDVYALGGTLFFALTTHEPPSVSARNQSIQQRRPDLPTLQDIVNSNPPEESPEAREARQFRLGVSQPAKPAPRHSRHVAQLGAIPPQLLQQLSRIILRAMAMRPKDRYQSVAELAHDLQMVMAHLPTPPPQPGPGSQPPNPNSTQPNLDTLYDQMVADGRIKPPTDQAGASMPQQMQTPSRSCSHCGSLLPTGAATCPNCGASVIPVQQNSARSGAQNAIQQLEGEQTLVQNKAKMEQSIPNRQVASVAQTPPQQAPGGVAQMSQGGGATPQPAYVQQQQQVMSAPQPQATVASSSPPQQSPQVSQSPKEPQLNLRVLLPLLLGRSSFSPSLPFSSSVIPTNNMETYND